MAWQSKDGAEHESDVTRKLTVYNDSCNSNNEENLDNSLEKNTSLNVDEFEGMDEQTVLEILFQRSLLSYDEEKIQEFLNEEIDENLPPLVFSAKAQKEMIDALSKTIDRDSATSIIEKQAARLQWERAQWKRERRRKRYNRVMKSMSVAAAVIVVFIGVGLLGDKAGAWSLPKISFNTIDRDTNTKVVLESNGDIVRTEIEQVYELGMVLDGYELVDSVVTPEMNIFYYANEHEETYTFMQQINSYGLSINTEHEQEELIDTLYGQACLYSYNERNGLFWSYQGYTFEIQGKISKNLLLELQNQLKIKE